MSYAQHLHVDAFNGQLDPFEAKPIGMLDWHMNNGGSIKTWLYELHGTRDLEAAGTWTAAWFDCLFEHRGYSLIRRTT